MLKETSARSPFLYSPKPPPSSFMELVLWNFSRWTTKSLQLCFLYLIQAVLDMFFQDYLFLSDKSLLSLNIMGQFCVSVMLKCVFRYFESGVLFVHILCRYIRDRGRQFTSLKLIPLATFRCSELLQTDLGLQFFSLCIQRTTSFTSMGSV